MNRDGIGTFMVTRPNSKQEQLFGTTLQLRRCDVAAAEGLGAANSDWDKPSCWMIAIGSCWLLS